MTNYLDFYKANPMRHNFLLQDRNKFLLQKNKKNNLVSNETLDNQKSNKSKSTFTLSTIAVISALLMGSKGVQKNITKYLNKLKNYLEYNLEINSINEKNHIYMFYEKFLKFANLAINKSESINNLISIKDIMFKKIMFETKITKSIHNGITTFFDKISRKTVRKSYKKTEDAFNKMEEKFKRLDDYISKHYNGEVITYKNKKYDLESFLKLSQDYREEVLLAAKSFVSNEAQKDRHNYIISVNAKSLSTFWQTIVQSIKSPKNHNENKKMWQTFIAAEQMKETKTRLAKDISVVRNLITYNADDKRYAIAKLLEELYDIIPSTAIQDSNLVRKLQWFNKNPEGLKNNKEFFLKELDKLRKQHPIEYLDKKVIEQLQEYKNKYIDLINELLKDYNDSGAIQDLVSIYYKMAPFEFAESGTLQAVKNAVKSFDESVNLERLEYFDKVRDLELGSAPTDVLTILFSIGMIARDLIKSKDKEQRISTVLTSGIPLAGAITTTMVTTSKLMSGGKSLILGIVTGAILNKLGKALDDYISKKSSR